MPRVITHTSASSFPSAAPRTRTPGISCDVEYDVSARANLIVIDAQRFRDDPVVVIELPMHVPYTFHGAFVPK